MKRPPLFTLMLTAFVTVIVLGFCGTGMVFVMSSRIDQGASGDSFRPPWVARPPITVATPVADGVSTPVPPHIGYSDGFRGGIDWRGPVSALLAFAAVLLGAATFFSNRVTRPLTRLTRAASTMAEGDLSVRVGSSAVREIDDLAGAFNTMAASLSDADRQRRKMTADVAHELRTPLAIIRGRLEGIQDGIYSATPEEIATLLNETALLERLIEDLRLLALTDAGQLPLHKESIAPASLLRSVAQSFAQQARGQGITLTVAAPASLMPDLPEVEADPQRIMQVLGNLVSNSLRHTPAGGSIVLNAWTSNQFQVQSSKFKVPGSKSEPGTLNFEPDMKAMCMSVSDTGIGIAPGDLPHVFDRFYRSDPSRTRAGGGAGLGLAIAKRLIEAHHGSIWAESAPGKGTTITFALPMA